MVTRVLLQKLGKLFPKRQTPFLGDFLGYSSGLPGPKEVDKVLLALDYDQEVAEFAQKNGISLVITHHPFLFARKNIALKDPEKLAVYTYSQLHHIAPYAMHTNFDCAPGGMNDHLAASLGLVDREVDSAHIIATGYLPTPLTLAQVAELVLELWKIPHLTVSRPQQEKMIRKIAVVGGSGSGAWTTALEKGADLLITGEIKHHHRRAAYFAGIALIEVDHQVERVFLPIMKQIINQLAPEIIVVTYDNQLYPQVYTGAPERDK